jgi:hypothetical protein
MLSPQIIEHSNIINEYVNSLMSPNISSMIS